MREFDHAAANASGDEHAGRHHPLPPMQRVGPTGTRDPLLVAEAIGFAQHAPDIGGRDQAAPAIGGNGAAFSLRRRPHEIGRDTAFPAGGDGIGSAQETADDLAAIASFEAHERARKLIQRIKRWSFDVEQRAGNRVTQAAG